MEALLLTSILWNVLLVYDVWQKKRELAACEASCGKCKKSKGGSNLDSKDSKNHK